MNCWEIYECFHNPEKYEKFKKHMEQSNEEESITFCGKDIGWDFPPYNNLKFTWVKQGDKKILTLDTCDKEDI